MNAYAGNEPYIFLSYAHADKALVEEILIGLKKEMCRVWYDEGLTPGESWNDDLAEHLRKAEAVVVMLTKHSVASQYVKMEINYAISKQIKLLPVFLEDMELPAGLEMLLGSTQYLDLHDRDVDQQISDITSALPGTVFAEKKVPFFKDERYSFYLEERTLDTGSQYSSDGFLIRCRDAAGEETTLFEFQPPATYDITYAVTQCRQIKDDYFIGEIRGIHIVNILARCCLCYPLTGPDFDLLLIFAVRDPEGDSPTACLIDYQYVRILQPDSLEEMPVGNSPFASDMDKLCRIKLYQR